MKHLKENNETYLSHLKFSGTMGLHLLIRGVIFILHGVFPLEVPKSIDLKNTCKLINKWEKQSQERKNNK